MATRAVIISDGKRGHENQSRVVARMLGDNAPLVMLLRPQAAAGLGELLLRLRLALAGSASLSKHSAATIVRRMLRPESREEFRALAHQVKEQGQALRLFTISTGTPSATLNLVAARMFGARSIVNMTPSLLPRSRFDLNIVPAHDVREGSALPENVVVSPLALGYHDQPAADLLAGQLAVEHQLPRDACYWGVAIGGPSRACPWVGDRVLDELAALHGLAKGMEAKLLVTTSRRTPAHCLTWLKSHYVNSQQVAYFLDAAQDPLNPLLAFYELCERMFITGDSFSMVSEAIQAGHKPVVLNVQMGDAPGKLGRALAMLAKHGWILPGDSRELPERLPAGTEPRLAANAQYEELRAAVRAKLGE